MKKLLLDRGFYMFKSCNCGGAYNESYRRDVERLTVINIIPSRDSFSVKKNGRLIKNGKSPQLGESINELLCTLSVK